MKNIIILNAQPGGNKGAEAMLETVISNINKQFGKTCKIFIEKLDDSPAYSDFKERLPFGVDFINFSPKKLLKPYDVDISYGDVVVDIGGINYHDRSLKANVRNLVRHFYFLRKKAQLIFFTQDFGPAQKISTKIIAKFVYSRSKAVFMRSEQSKVFLEDLLGNNSRVKICGAFPDCTFMLESDGNLESDKLPSNYFVLAPSAIMYNQYGEDYIKLFVKLSTKFAKSFYPVILLHNFTKNGESSDHFVCTQLYRDLEKNNVASTLIVEEKTPSELKAILKGSQFSISSRYHVVVGSMSSGVPSIALGWSHKYLEFLNLYSMRQLNVEYGEESYFTVVSEFGDVSNLNDLKLTIEATNLKLKRKVAASFEELFVML